MCSSNPPPASPPPTPIAPTEYTSGIEFGGVSMKARQLGRKRDILKAGGLTPPKTPVVAPQARAPAQLGGVPGIAQRMVKKAVGTIANQPRTEYVQPSGRGGAFGMAERAVIKANKPIRYQVG